MKTVKIIVISLFLLVGITVFAQDSQFDISPTKSVKIDTFIAKNQKKWKIPGVAIFIINGEDDIQ